jgi:hypothetical protein
MSDHPHTREAVERWQQGKINIFDALAELEDQRDEVKKELAELNERFVSKCLKETRLQMQVDEKWALRRELETELGITSEMANDESLRFGLEAIQRLKKERDAAQAECEEQAQLLGKSAEREDVLRTKAEQQKQEILKYTAVLEDIRAGYEGTCYACEPAAELNVEYRDASRELIRLLEIEEESDMGNVFRPNVVRSCRVVDGMQINQCLKKLKELAAE